MDSRPRNRGETLLPMMRTVAIPAQAKSHPVRLSSGHRALEVATQLVVRAGGIMDCASDNRAPLGNDAQQENMMQVAQS